MTLETLGPGPKLHPATQCPQHQPAAGHKPQDKHDPRPDPEPPLQPDPEPEYDYVAQWLYYWDEMHPEHELRQVLTRQVLDLVCAGNVYALQAHRALAARRVRLAALRLLLSS